MMKIWVDADACPVKDAALRVAERHGLKVFVVSNGGIRPSPHPLVETVIVAEGPDAADMWIADRVGPGDICVTGDIPLAAGGGAKPFSRADRSRFLDALERMVRAAGRD